MRFQKRVKLFPGLTLNFSKKGVSTSVGVPGARVTYGHGQKRTTVGLPGTGLSHSVVEKTGGELVPAPRSGWAIAGSILGGAALALVVVGGAVLALVLAIVGASGTKRGRR